jgi:cysteine desulfurase/selenocysteine lyase
MFDVSAVREDFPILRQEMHPGKRLVFLDSAASSQKPVQVIDAMSALYRETYANVHRGVYRLSDESTDLYESAREKVRAFINARSHREIVFVRNATEAVNLAAWSWGRENLGPGDVVLLTEMEHHANIVPWQVTQEAFGFEIKFAPITDAGEIDMHAYTQLLRDNDVKLAAFTHVSNVLGTINPVGQLITLAHRAGAKVLIDGAQAVPHMPVDVRALDADFYAFSGHKMLAPTGIGVLYGKQDILEKMPPFMGGGDMIKRVRVSGTDFNDLPYKFEAGTPAIAEAIGLGAAIDYLNALGMENIHAHEVEVTAYAMERLTEFPGLRVIGPPDGKPRAGLTSFTMASVHPHDIAQILDAEGVAIRAGHHCAQPLHDRLGISATARASYYVYNTLDEVDRLIDALEQVQSIFMM